MGIITHPDQMAKTREFEHSGIMFPKGAHQMVAYCYAMEGVAAYEKSIHAKMIDMRNSGDIEPFPIDGVNMSGSTTIEKRGECAKKRQQIEECVGDGWLTVCGIFGPLYITDTYIGLQSIANEAYNYLNSGRFKAHRGRLYVGDVTLYALRPSFNREMNCPYEILKKHQIRERYFFRDVGAVKRWFRQKEDAILSKVSKKFSDGVVLPCVGVSQAV